MNAKPEFFRAIWAGAIGALVFSGCSEIPATRVEVPGVTINGHPVPLILDTGASGFLFTQSSAAQAGLRYDSPPRAATNLVNGIPESFSDPAQIKIGDREMTMPVAVLPLPWYMRWPLTSDFPGTLGWDTIRDNIIVFDSTRRVVRAEEQLPAETAGWLKYKVHPDGELVLETPLPDGKTGLILVDTGSPLGLGLSAEEFIKWKAAHPDAPLVREFYGPMDKDDLWQLNDYWTEEINFFSLNFTHMTVRKNYSNESSYAGTLGMYALAQMDLVVDGKNGFAYLRTKKTDTGIGVADGKQESLHPPTVKGDWVFEGNIQLNPVNLFLAAANYKLGAKDYPGALADLDRVIKIDSENEHAHWLLAMIKGQELGDFAGSLPEWDWLLQFKPDNLGYAIMRAWGRLHTGDYDGAIADYTNILKTHPDNVEAFLERGMAEEIKGESAMALADYDEVIKLKPDDSVYARLFRQLVLRQLSRPSENFGQVVATWKDSWTKTLGLYVAGDIDESVLLKAAADRKTPAGIRASVRSLLLYGDDACLQRRPSRGPCGLAAGRGH